MKTQPLKTPKIIAEIGCNHRGDLSTAKEMITVLSTFVKADVAKFQKRHPRELLTGQEYNSPHPNPQNAYGKTYGEHREFLEFNIDQHKNLFDWCKQSGIEYSTSVWDLTSARESILLKPEFLKIPSACNLNQPLLDLLCRDFPGEIHLSLGMTNREEEEAIVRFFESKGRNKDLVLYSCTSGYPVAFEDICLMEICRLKNTFDHRVKAIGFSGHHLGIAADIAAMTLGAMYIERHFTLDRTWKGTDHAASLEPDGMRKLCRDIRNVSKALKPKETSILDVEDVQRQKLKKNQIRWPELSV